MFLRCIQDGLVDEELQIPSITCPQLYTFNTIVRVNEHGIRVLWWDTWEIFPERNNSFYRLHMQYRKSWNHEVYELERALEIGNHCNFLIYSGVFLNAICMVYTRREKSAWEDRSLCFWISNLKESVEPLTTQKLWIYQRDELRLKYL